MNLAIHLISEHLGLGGPVRVEGNGIHTHGPCLASSPFMGDTGSGDLACGQCDTVQSSLSIPHLGLGTLLFAFSLLL